MTLAALFAVFGSVVWVVTVALSVAVGDAADVGVTTMLIVTVAPLASVPRVAVTVPPDCRGVIPVGDAGAETNVTPAGSTLLKATPGALLGPLLVTLIVYDRSLPACTGPAGGTIDTDTSEAGLTVVVTLAELFVEPGSAVALETSTVFVIEEAVAIVGFTSI